MLTESIRTAAHHLVFDREAGWGVLVSRPIAQDFPPDLRAGSCLSLFDVDRLHIIREARAYGLELLPDEQGDPALAGLTPDGGPAWWLSTDAAHDLDRATVHDVLVKLAAIAGVEPVVNSLGLP